MSEDNGGSAFPVIEKQYEDHRDGGFFFESTAGMTLRDYFAAKALGGYLSDSNVRGTVTDLAMDAYSMADAMLAERSK